MSIYDLIGTPWSLPCDPPNSFDCWELVVHVREILGRPVKPCPVTILDRRQDHVAMLQNPDLSLWQRLSAPTYGCIVGVGTPVQHCGIYLDDRKVLHAFSDDGINGAVQLHRLDVLERFFNGAEFWEHG